MVAGPGPGLLALALALWPAGLWARPRLQEAGGGQRAPGDSVTLSCRGSGYPFRSHGIYWYRQSPGESLAWVSFIGSDPRVLYFDQSVQGRAKMSRDNSRSEVYLSLLTLQPRDSARYYCAVPMGGWSTTATGSGTILTVEPKVVEKTTASQVVTTVETTPLPTTFHTEVIISEEQNTTVVMCTDKFDSSMVTILPDPKEQRVNMLSMTVLGLRVLLAKGIAFNTLMSIKLFLF